MKRKRKRIVWVAGLLAAIPFAVELLYVLAANAVLYSGVIQRAISTPPENINLAWDRAYSPWPGRVYVSGFRLKMQDPNVEWRLTIDNAKVDVVLSQLLHHSFSASHVRGEGVTFRFLTKVDSIAGQERRVAAFPPIEGFPRPALRPNPIPPLLTDAQMDALLHVQLEDVDATINELWVLEYRYHGPAHVHGAFALQPLRNLWVGPALLRLEGGELTAGEHMVSKALKLRADVTIAPIDLLSSQGLLVLHTLSTSIQFHTPIEDLSVAGLYLDGLRVRGAGKLTADLQIASGRLMPGSALEAWLPGSDVRVEGYTFTGDAFTKLSVTHEEGLPMVYASLSGTLKGLLLEKEPVAAELSDVTAELFFADNDISHVPEFRRAHATLGEARVADTRAITKMVGRVVPLITPLVLGDGPLVASATAHLTPEYTLVRLTHLKLGDAELEGAAVPGANGWNGALAGHFGKISLGLRLRDSKLQGVPFAPQPWLGAELTKAGIDPE